MTESTNGHALAVNPPPALTEQQLRQRLQVARSKGFGLEGATKEQLQMIFLLCQRYRLDPELHLTLYRGRPWVTIDGRVELAKRNPDYLDFRARPLSKDEKDAWDFPRDDLVVEVTIRCRSGASFAAMGKVTGAERKGNTPAATHPQEMAVKRAFARTARLAFGQSAYLDEDDVEDQLDEGRQAQLSQRYDEIYGAEEEPYVPTRERDVPDRERAQQLADQAKQAAKQTQLSVDEIEAQRQQREEGLRK